MSNINEDELDAFVCEAEMVAKQVKDLAEGKVTPEEIERKQKFKHWKEKLDEDERKKAKEEKLRMGREGKGEKFNYSHLCKACFVEYELPTPICLRCAHPTITKEQRKKELSEKVEELKSRTQHHKERKMQWDNWIKTKAITHKKFLNNYKKWDFFEEESDEEEKNTPPIVPKDDPNFQALEKDINDRSKRRKESREKSDKLKLEGNKALSNGNYNRAVKKYTEAIELSKDYFQLYTNRALANIKLCKWQECITDCSKVLEFLECFEDGYTQSKDLAFKCLLRRAMAHQSLKSYDIAVNDGEQAIKLFPDSKEAKDLLDNIKKDRDTDIKGTEALKIPRPELDKALEKWADLLSQKDVKQSEFDEVIAIIQNKTQNTEDQLYFLRKDGYKIIEYSLKAYIPGILQIVSDMVSNNDLIGELMNLKLIDRMIETVMNLYDMKEVKIEYGWKSIEVLESLSLIERARVEICKTKVIFKLAAKCLNHIKKSLRFESLYSLMANIFYHGGAADHEKYLTHILNQTFELMKLCVETLDDNKEDRVFKLTLYVSICSFIRNMITNEKIREEFSGYAINKQIQEIFKRNCNCIKSQSEYFCENLLDIFINASVSLKYCDQAADYEIPIYCENLFTYTKELEIKKKLVSLMARLCKSKKTLILVSKCINIHRYCLTVIIDSNTALIPDALRMLSYQFDIKGKTIALYEIVSFCKSLSKILTTLCNQKDFVNFSNGCTLAGKILKIKEYETHAELFKSNISELINVVANTSSICRKQAAILLSILSKNEKLNDIVKSLHGTEVLHSVAEYIIDHP